MCRVYSMYLLVYKNFPSCDDRSDTAAILIGGVTNIELGDDGLPGGLDGNGEVLATVEIFGCPQNPTGTVSPQHFYNTVCTSCLCLTILVSASLSYSGTRVGQVLYKQLTKLQ